MAGDGRKLHRPGVSLQDSSRPVQQTVGDGQWRHHDPRELLARLSTQDLGVRPEDRLTCPHHLPAQRGE